MLKKFAKITLDTKIQYKKGKKTIVSSVRAMCRWGIYYEWRLNDEEIIYSKNWDDSKYSIIHSPDSPTK